MTSRHPQTENLIYFSGIHEHDGDYALPPMTWHQMNQRFARADSPQRSKILKRQLDRNKKANLDVVPWVDARRLDQTGWGVIFHRDADEVLKQKLQPLLELRRQQAGDLYRCFDGEQGCQSGETVDAWLSRHGSGRGPVNPEKVPYYLMLVGGPERIPFDWQFQLDVQFAVGRICFDFEADYGHYAETVCRAVRGEFVRPSRLEVFAPTHPNDRLCDLSKTDLAEPICKGVLARNTDWQLKQHLGRTADKDSLSEILNGTETPALLFSAGHALCCKGDSPWQRARQGALICGDWPGPKTGKILAEHYFCAGDVSGPPAGLIAFFFGCHTAGTPRSDPYWREQSGVQGEITSSPYVAPLPRKLLAHPLGGALACIGHVEQAWPMSFQNSAQESYVTTFSGAIHRLLSGYPVGAAMEGFNQRHAELAVALVRELELAEFGANINPLDLARLWSTYNDARAYMVVGDPAVTLAVAH